MLDDHAGRSLELEREQAGGGEVVEVVVGELGPVELAGRAQTEPARGRAVEGRGLVRET